MCGIAGIINFSGTPVPAESIDRFTDSLAHRGPDGRGIWIDPSGHVALGHRRLAILDLSEGGHQPMSYLDGRYIITYNGEIYNFLEIREELAAAGYSFMSQSDTEVILAAYDHWRDQMLFKFNGMWAFAIWDRNEQTLFMSRDRFGIKPFHYRLCGDGLSFASELKSFHCLDGFSCEIDMESANFALREPFSLEGGRRTLLKGVMRLQAGHSALLQNGALTVSRWWNTLDHLVEPPIGLEAQATEFHRLFSDAVRLRMRSDVRIGTCLSGGFDSTAVACTMNEIGASTSAGRSAANWRHAFVATFPGKQNNEQPQAEEAARFAQVEAHLLEIKDEDATRDIDRVLRDFEELYINLPSPVWWLYRSLRSHGVYVTLDGHGADELMGGYRGVDYALFSVAPAWWRSPIKNFLIIKEYLKTRPPSPRPPGLLTQARKLLRIQFNHHPDFQFLKSHLRGLKRKVKAALGGGHAATKSHPDFRIVGADDTLPASWGVLNCELYHTFHGTVLPTILRNYDRLSMAHGIEVRMPFMDYRLVTFVMSLPGESKLALGQTKLVAREAMRNRMPESIRSAKIKIGFNSPMPEWLQGPLSPWIAEVLNHAQNLEDLPFDVEALRQLLAERQRDGSWTWENCDEVWLKLHYLWVLCSLEID